MTRPLKILAIALRRTVDAPPSEVYSAWLIPRVTGTPWHETDKLSLHPTVTQARFSLQFRRPSNRGAGRS